MITRMKKAIQRRCYSLLGIGYRNFGKMSCVYKPLTIIGKKYISIGEHCNIGEFARIECIDLWRGKKYSPSIIIGDNTSIENFLHITAASTIKIGHDCVISSRVMITNIDHDYSEVSKKINEQKLLVNDVCIGDYCFLGMDVKIFPGVSIGDNVVVGANSIVMYDLPAYTVCVGIPAKPIKKYNFISNRWEKI